MSGSFVFQTPLSGPRHTVSVTRIRRTTDSWKGADETTVPDAWVEQRESDASPDPQSEQTVTVVSVLIVPRATDVRTDDRIRDAEGRLYDVDEVPSANTNPISGYGPFRVVPLVRVH